jgi:nuclear transport factor 2 (NTF2) superfamily protein
LAILLAHELNPVRACSPAAALSRQQTYQRDRGVPATEVGARAHELEYRLIKEVWAHAGNRIALRFAYEYQDESGTWFRVYGNENWQFDADGLMERRIASINKHPIAETLRKFHWKLGRRPNDHPGLTDLDL